MFHRKLMLGLIAFLCAGLMACNGVPDQPTAGSASHSGASTGASSASEGLPVTDPQPRSGTLTPDSTASPAPAAATPTTSTRTASNEPAILVASSLPAVTIHLAGDSTVSNYAATTTQEGWGMELGQFFNEKVTVNNQAVGGANVQSFKGSGNWTRILGAIKPGDYVLMQFGANDSGTAHGPVTPADYAATLGVMAEEVKAKGGTAIFVTPSAFFDWTAGKQNNARLAPYAAACYEAGKAKHVLVDDLNARGVEWLNGIGQTAAAPFYLPSRTGVPDKAHFVKAGAVQMAKLVAKEIKRIESPLAAYLK